jgi:hypothetical protein
MVSDRRRYTGSCIGGLPAAPLGVAHAQTVAPAGKSGVPRLRTAQALGLAVPRSLSLRADEVIQ